MYVHDSNYAPEITHLYCEGCGAPLQYQLESDGYDKESGRERFLLRYICPNAPSRFWQRLGLGRNHTHGYYATRNVWGQRSAWSAPRAKWEAAIQAAVQARLPRPVVVVTRPTPDEVEAEAVKLLDKIGEDI